MYILDCSFHCFTLSLTLLPNGYGGGGSRGIGGGNGVPETNLISIQYYTVPYHTKPLYRSIHMHIHIHICVHCTHTLQIRYRFKYSILSVD